jgi:hypothetical protein
MLWRTARNLLSFLDTKAKSIQLAFEKAITGKVATPARYEIILNPLSFLDAKAKSIQLAFEKTITGKVATPAR